MYTGHTSMARMGLLDRLNGLDHLPFWSEPPCNSIKASEGTVRRGRRTAFCPLCFIPSSHSSHVGLTLRCARSSLASRRVASAPFFVRTAFLNEKTLFWCFGLRTVLTVLQTFLLQTDPDCSLAAPSAHRIHSSHPLAIHGNLSWVKGPRGRSPTAAPKQKCAGAREGGGQGREDLGGGAIE